MEGESDEQRQRFLVELEFVQCLANPLYIDWLATQVYHAARCSKECERFVPPHAFAHDTAAKGKHSLVGGSHACMRKTAMGRED
jgi:hypothetical protein